MSIPKIPKLSPARAPRRVAMPRVRRAKKPTMSLTEAVHRVLVRVRASVQPFGVFVIDGRLVISNARSDRFQALQRRSPSSLIGTYGPGLKIADALDDLCDHFSDDEGPNGSA